MADEGEIRTCFLTAKLPRWAGVRHNVAGSTVSGQPVASPEMFAAGRTSQAATLMTLRNIATARPMEDQLTTLTEQNLQLEAELNAAAQRVAALEQSVAELERNLEQVMQRVNMVI